MKLVSLKNANDDDCCTPGPMPAYGYGLRIMLNDEQCEALGITKALAPGTTFTLEAKGLVASSSSEVDNDADGGADEVTVSLQITDMALSTGSVKQNAADILYGKSST